MSDILTKICELKKKELESLKNNQDFVGIKRKTKVRDFLSKLKNVIIFQLTKPNTGFTSG